MRTYNFRGKRVDNKEWVYGKLVVIAEMGRYYILPLGEDVFQNYKQNYIEVCAIEVIPETVGQFIEEDDSDGNELYDGDIIKYLDGEYETEDTLESDWLITSIIWGGKHHYPAFDIADSPYEMNGLYEIWDGGFGVHRIGNIHDNPELLKEK